MDHPLTIEALRRELGVTQEKFARMIGLANKGSVSVIERQGSCSLKVALEIERLSGGRIDAAALNEDVAGARARIIIDDQAEPGAWADAIAHSPNLRVENIDLRTHDGQSAIDDEAPEHMRIVLCSVCDRRIDGVTARGAGHVERRAQVAVPGADPGRFRRRFHGRADAHAASGLKGDE